MTESHDMTAPEMTRVTVRVPKTTLDQIGRWVDSLGVRRSHFLGIALVAGARSLMRTCSPETFAPPARARSPEKEGVPAGQRTDGEGGEVPEETLQAVQEMVGSALSELRGEMSALRVELLGSTERTTHPEKPKKGRS